MAVSWWYFNFISQGTQLFGFIDEGGFLLLIRRIVLCKLEKQDQDLARIVNVLGSLWLAISRSYLQLDNQVRRQNAEYRGLILRRSLRRVGPKSGDKGFTAIAYAAGTQKFHPVVCEIER